MCVEKRAAPGVAALRRRLRERALDNAVAPAADAGRVWMEALERRVMLDAATVTALVAATVHLDPNFGNHGYAMAPLPFENGGSVFLDPLVAAPGGKIYTAAQVSPPGDDWGTTTAIARFNANGSPDESFGQHGVILFKEGSVDTEVGSLLVQLDGKLVVVLHTAITHEGSYAEETAVLRFNVNGTLDLGFGIQGRVLLASSAEIDPFQPFPGLPWLDNHTPTAWLHSDGKIMAVRTHPPGA